MNHSSEFDAIMLLFRRDLSSGTVPAEGLDALLAASQARAAGLWRLEAGKLLQVGFRAVPEMPEEVKSSFASATATVSLDQTGLGIVKAVLNGAPVVAELEERAGELGGSAGWLARFECRASLAVPTTAEQAVNGVLAVSSSEKPDPGGSTWRLLSRLAASLGVCL